MIFGNDNRTPVYKENSDLYLYTWDGGLTLRGIWPGEVVLVGLHAADPSAVHVLQG